MCRWLRDVYACGNTVVRGRDPSVKCDFVKGGKKMMGGPCLPEFLENPWNDNYKPYKCGMCANCLKEQEEREERYRQAAIKWNAKLKKDRAEGRG